MLRLRRMKTLQNLASVHANVHNQFNLERYLVDRQTYKERRSAALAECQIPGRSLGGLQLICQCKGVCFPSISADKVSRISS